MTGNRQPFPVVDTPFEDGDTKHGAAFSPDGQWLAYQSDRTSRYEIYLQPFPGPAGPIQVSTDGGFSPQWRGDGRELFFLGAANTLLSASVRLDGTSADVDPPRRLFEFPADAEYAEYAASPDGQRFLISRLVTPPVPITVLLNWGGDDK